MNLTAGTDLNINAAVSATGANAGLNLTATHNISVIAPVTLSGTSAALAMNFGGDYSLTTPADPTVSPVAPLVGSITLSGVNASLTINATPYTLIHSMDQLAALTPRLLDSNGNPVTDPYASSVTVHTYVYPPATGHYAIAQDIDASANTYNGTIVQTLAARSRASAIRSVI